MAWKWPSKHPVYRRGHIEMHSKHLSNHTAIPSHTSYIFAVIFFRKCKNKHLLSLQTCPASLYLPVKRGVCVWPGGLRDSVQPPALLWLPWTAGRAGRTDPHRNPGARGRTAVPPTIPLKHGGPGCKYTTPPNVHNIHSHTLCKGEQELKTETLRFVLCSTLYRKSSRTSLYLTDVIYR